MSRPSSIYRPGNSSLTSRRIHHVIPQDSFPLLDFKEISICLQSCDFIANEELVSRPTSQYIKTLLEQLLDSFMGLSADNINGMVRNVNKNDLSMTKTQDAQMEEEPENGGSQIEDDDDITSSVRLILLHRGAYEFFSICGVNDFTLMDIMRPEPQRIRRILSAVVNYARFREENSVECEKLVSISEGNLEQLKVVQNENSRLSNKINDLKYKIEANETDEGNKKATLKQITTYNSKLENELKKLKKNQEILTLEHSKYKDEKRRLIEKLEDHNYLIMESNKELDKLKSYLLSNPEILTKIIEDLKTNLSEYQTNLADLESKNKNMTISIESFQLVEQELKNLFRILEEVLNDLTKEETSLDKLNKYQEFKEQQNLTLNDLNRQIQQVTRQLNNTEEKIKRLRHQSSERSEASKQKLISLKDGYDTLVKERKVKEQELNKKKDFISELETKMNGERSNFQIELRNAELAVAKLNSHVKLYLTEMNKKVD
ncbi:DEHA2E15092p [Debaryomyces hansenii CBS767]|uniref:Probable kinetochore protein NUF2 n=1 Tax=Debaryomyces hansenii (strain ATCC 36239 / CBS 767 / BCRC 21394 / JCM 1990 / NBRC 0083 / IGC 2968) TaxID=284592 RepID=NUF2_DEBHA|nr:DEHA2E15092p [Debaryomyces hansenii CBS767]Q6BPA9.2 RecName: Full=Probable kinetochore protein NUF2 [Debaryomyces hansenii CBS767]CAG88207.2 DEHA2E15092p [Debaryomyces hansenii CBS767]|eukprot:XP_459961.2 DEHA2E15092p [Debaryomyces hansenii CBS767]